MTDFKTELAEKGILIYTNKGVSMLPLLRQDKDILVIKAKTDGFQVNDAVLFIRSNGQYILHRIRKVLPNNKYYIIGDNCTAGETVSEAQIIGILTEIRRNKKSIKTTDFGYKLYVAYVPVRRFFLVHIRFGIGILRKIYHKLK